MKRLLLFIGISFFFSFAGYSQCTPDMSWQTTGIRPDSADNLPHAIIGVPYSTVMDIHVPVDTVHPQLGTFDWEYAKLISFTGFPPGFTYACNPSNCTFPANSNGCVLITGPALASTGTYNLTAVVNYRLHNHLFPSFVIDTNLTVDYYFIQVDSTTGIADLSEARFNVSQNKPNPFSHNTTIEFSTPSHDNFILKVSNILGKIVYTKNIIAQRGINKITFSGRDLDSGIYFYSLTNGKNAITRRMIIQND
jgi:hypothetical protein